VVRTESGTDRTKPAQKHRADLRAAGSERPWIGTVRPEGSVVDDNQFSDQVARWGGNLLRWARQHAGNEHDAQDLFQEVLARAWERREQLREGERFDGWLFTIARNILNDHGRRSARAPSMSQPVDDAFAENVPSPDAEPGPVSIEDVRGIFARLLETLTAAVATDPSAERFANYLRAGAEVGYHDKQSWANRLGITVESLRAYTYQFAAWCRENGVSRADYVGVLVGLSILGASGVTRASGPDTASDGKTVAAIDDFCREMLARIASLWPTFAERKYRSTLDSKRRTPLTRGELFDCLSRMLASKESQEEYGREARVRDSMADWFGGPSLEVMGDDPAYADADRKRAGLWSFLNYAFWVNLYPTESTYDDFRAAWGVFRKTPTPPTEVVISRSGGLAASILGIFDRFYQSLRPG
jgi:RNA polymerase sigma factor (sigma-70 family)